MKILMVSEFFPDLQKLSFSGGVEARAYFVAKELSKKHQVTVLTSNLGGSKLETSGNLTILKVGSERPYRAVAGNVRERLLFIRQATAEGAAVDAELVEGSNFITHFIAAGVARKKKIPSVAWYPEVWIGDWVSNTGLVGITGEMLERYNRRRGFGAFIAISKETAKKLESFTKKRIFVIPCGVDLSEFKGRIKKPSYKTIISVGRLSRNKNHKVIIEAFSKLKDLKTKLVIVGSGPLKKQLKQQTESLGLTPRVTFLENIPRKKLINLLLGADVFASASKVEGFGIATIEAAASGVPYVVSNIPVYKEVTKNGLGGFLADSDDATAFAERMEELLENKKLYLKKSRDAKKLAAGYTWDKIASETEKVYKTLI